MSIELLCKPYRTISGLARYSRSLVDQFERRGFAHRVAYPKIPRAVNFLSQKTPFDLTTFLQTFPLAANFEKRDALKHLTSQEMGTWLTLHRHPRTIVTVHDIFPHILRGDVAENYHPVERAFHRLAMHGLHYASHLITDSDYTKQTIVEHLGISADKITPIPLAIDHDLFRPQPVPDSFYRQFALDPAKRFLLYVGSDAPRKNLGRLLEAFVRVRRDFPAVELVKVGAFTSAAHAQKFEREIARLGLEGAVRIVGGVSAENLVNFYNAASLFVFPSYYEGFGFPPLEALACGTPVVCSNVASLPEVVGEAALLFAPEDVGGMAAQICRLLDDPAHAATLSKCGQQHARSFSWQKTADQTIQIYRQTC
jgi:glycosyltransferase involved in cell wall biosynthesis